MKNNGDALPPIAIVGVGAMFPGRGTTIGFWRDIVEGRDAVREVPPTHWRADDYFDPDPKAPDKVYCTRGAFIPAFPFDPIEFGTPPSALEVTDTLQLIALYVAKQVLTEASKTRFKAIDRERISVVMGVTAGSELLADLSARIQQPIWLKVLREEGIAEPEAQAICDRIANHFPQWRENSFPGLLGNVVAGRITNRLDLGGTNCTADAACASSFAALRYAAQELWLGESDLVLAGGADALNNITTYMCFSKTPAMSRSGDCRPFADVADGTILGEGTGIFAVRRLADAERDGNHIYAVIRGIGASSDARANSVYAPRAEGQALALERAYQQASYSPRTVELMEAHGTGTTAGDAAEFSGLTQVFTAADESSRQWCALGSIKSQIGHTKAAAGAAGMFKAVLALHHKVLPPTLKVERPNPKLNIENSPFYLNTQARPWIRGKDHPRRAAVSSFGFGGSNFHVALEEYSGEGDKPPKFRALPAELVVLSGDSASSLIASAKALAQSLQHDDDLAYAAVRSYADFDHAAPHRLALIAGSLQDLRTRVADAITQIEAGRPVMTPDLSYAFGPAEAGRVAFLFSGQGSQYLNMGGSLAMAFDAARAPFDEAADAENLAAPLHQIVFPNPVFSDVDRAAQLETLTATENAQPAIAAVQLGHLALLQQFGLKPDAVAGHSFGEVMALHAAGCFNTDTALRLARRRGLAMREAARGTEGAMLAVPLDLAKVQSMLAASRSKAVIGNDNSPRQVILSGPTVDIEIVAQEFAAVGVQVSRLPVATAFHSSIVAGAVDAMRKVLREIEMASPAVPVYANTTAARHGTSVAEIAEQLARQIGEPVRFRELVEAMYRDGVRTFLEVGPGSVLTGLVGQILGASKHVSLALDNKRTDGVIQLLRSLGRLAVSGLAIDFSPLTHGWQGLEPRPIPPKHAVWLCGANYNKPYPPKDAAAGLPQPNLPLQYSPDMAASQDPLLALSAPIPEAVVELSIANSSPADAPPVEIAPIDVEPMPANPPQLVDGSQMRLPPKHAVWLCGANSNKPYPPKDAAAGLPQPNLLLQYSPGRAASQDPLLALSAPIPEAVVELSIANSSPADAPPVEIAPNDVERMPADPPQLVDGLQMRQGLKHVPISVEAEEDEMSKHTIPALRAVQESAATEHRRFLETISQSHLAFLHVCETAIGRVQTFLRETPIEQVQTTRDTGNLTINQAANQTAAILMTIGSERALDTAAPPLGLASEVGSPPAAAIAPPASALTSMSQANPTTAKGLNGRGASITVPAQSKPGPALADLVREVVAEKTGYPTDMLDLDMELEAELGVDSIKQVEILAGLHERLPTLPEIAPSQLAQLRTLRQIAAALASSGTLVAAPSNGAARGMNGTRALRQITTTLASNGAPATAPSNGAAYGMNGSVHVAAPSVTAPSSTPTVEPNAAPAPALADLVREVVAEKTGYPTDMLDLDMELEAELGVDSIKQVEILAGLHERLPTLPEIAPSQLAQLRTLRQIAAALASSGTLVAAPSNGAAYGMNGSVHVAAPSITAPSSTPAVAPSAAPAQSAPAPSLADLVREVVAEKTGYPTDMLDLDMELEAELGVDSIKQVEILAGLHERLPTLPEIAPSQLAQLRTLRQIAAALASSGTLVAAPSNGAARGMNGSAHVAPPSLAAPSSTPAVAPNAAPAPSLADLVREVVAEKTGYPTDMLDLDMELEAELGVDSIKQVEILAGLHERLPTLPEIAPSQLAQLRTLRQIAAALASNAAPVASANRTIPVLNIEADEIARKSSVYRQVVDVEEVPASGQPMSGFDKRARIAVTPDNVRVAEALVGELSRRGLDAAVGLETRPDASVVISTGGLADHLDPEAVHLAAFQAARALASHIGDGGRSAFVTLQDTGGNFGRGLRNLGQALRGGLTGLAKTARFEWPEAAVKAIDIQRGTATDQELARRIVDELLHGGPNVEVGLPADGRRIVPVVRAAPLGQIGANKVRDGLVFVVSGGGRGVTAEAIAGLAGLAHLRFVLLGRTELIDWPAHLAKDVKPTEIRSILAERATAEARKPSPRDIGQLADRLLASRDIRATLERVKAAGSEAVYLSVDVGDAAAVKLKLDQVRGKWGRISGLIHGAGVLADKLIKDKTDAQVSQVFRTKVGGLGALLQALEGEPLEFINLFASIAGRFGNPGQADYAMANEVLNRVAWVLATTRPNCHVSAINWGPWDGGMVDDRIRAQFAARGVPIIPVGVGVEGFIREIAAGNAPAETVFAGLSDAVGGVDPAIGLATKQYQSTAATNSYWAI